jgi:eukaryotic-like serine/threonine-protein kinase
MDEMNTTLAAARWQLIKRLLADALEQPAERRRHYVAEQAGDDLALLSELETLLAAAEPARSLLDAAPAELALDALGHQPPMIRIPGMNKLVKSNN